MEPQVHDSNVGVARVDDTLDVNDVGETSSTKVKRRGDVEKCPVCGSRVDAEAYHCPSCRNYFCYHCRARVLPTDILLQCVNQACDYYGKLVCGVCDVAHEKEEAPVSYAEPEDGYWPAWLVLCIIAAALAWYFHSFNAAAAVAIAGFVTGGYLLQRAGINIFGWERKLEHQRMSKYHNCIHCQVPANELPRK
jgi:hypothetical protein